MSMSMSVFVCMSMCICMAVVCLSLWPWHCVTGMACSGKLWSQGRAHQVFSVEGDIVPPGGDKLIITVEDAAVHVLIPPRVKEWFKPTQPGREEEKEREGEGEREREREREREWV